MYHIRVAEERDILYVYQFINWLEEVNFSFNTFEAIYKENISKKENHYLVAESVSNGIVGFISCHTQNLLHHCGRVAEIQELYLHQQYRSQGIGRYLVNELQARLAQCASIEVTVQNKRAGTHFFYEQLEFKSTHRKFVKQPPTQSRHKYEE